MTVQMTAAGEEARSIMRWAWQDPQQRAEAALETVQEMGAGAEGAAANEIGDATVMLSRLVGTLDPGPPPQALGAQLSRPETIGGQLELSAIHGHHIPGTSYTFRHGWIPLIGQHLNDPYPEWLVKEHRLDKRLQRSLDKRRTAAEAAAIQRGESSALASKRRAVVPNAQHRGITPEMDRALRRHAEQVARAQRAREHAANPALPNPPSGTLPTKTLAVKNTLPGYEVHRPPSRNKTVPADAAQELIHPGSLMPRTTMPHGQPDTAAEAASVFSGVETTAPAHQAAVAIGQAMKVEPGTAGEQLQKEDPALLSLAAPGASMAALKSYIDARVAAEVARQVGQITAQQHDEIQARLGAMHRSQQHLIAFMRSQVKQDNAQVDRIDRIHLAMYSLFTAAGVGAAIAGLAVGVTPIVGAIIAGLTPMVQIIHDYVRSD